MTPQEQADFVRSNHHAVLITRRRDDRVQSSPIVCGADDEGRILISVTAHRAKTKNIRRDPRVALCVLPDAFFGDWTQIDGTAEIVELPDAMPGLESVYRQVQGEHPNWDEFRAAMHRDDRCLVRITISG